MANLLMNVGAAAQGIASGQQVRSQLDTQAAQQQSIMGDQMYKGLDLIHQAVQTGQMDEPTAMQYANTLFGHYNTWADAHGQPRINPPTTHVDAQDAQPSSPVVNPVGADNSAPATAPGGRSADLTPAQMTGYTNAAGNGGPLPVATTNQGMGTAGPTMPGQAPLPGPTPNGMSIAKPAVPAHDEPISLFHPDQLTPAERARVDAMYAYKSQLLGLKQDTLEETRRNHNMLHSDRLSGQAIRQVFDQGIVANGSTQAAAATARVGVLRQQLQEKTGVDLANYDLKAVGTALQQVNSSMPAIPKQRPNESDDDYAARTQPLIDARVLQLGTTLQNLHGDRYTTPNSGRLPGNGGNAPVPLQPGQRAPGAIAPLPAAGAPPGAPAVVPAPPSTPAGGLAPKPKAKGGKLDAFIKMMQDLPPAK